MRLACSRRAAVRLSFPWAGMGMSHGFKQPKSRCDVREKMSSLQKVANDR